jgi:hypothetical protein
MQSLRKRTLGSRRARPRELRRAGVTGDDLFHEPEEELDLADVAVDRREKAEVGTPWPPSSQTQAQKIGIQQPLDRHTLRLEILECRRE